MMQKTAKRMFGEKNLHTHTGTKKQRGGAAEGGDWRKIMIYKNIFIVLKKVEKTNIAKNFI